MQGLLNLLEEFRRPRLIARTALVIPWLVVGWWIVVACFTRAPSPTETERDDLQASQA